MDLVCIVLKRNTERNFQITTIIYLVIHTYSIGKETHRSSLARFNIILQSGENDFERMLTTNKQMTTKDNMYINRCVTTNYEIFDRVVVLFIF